MLTSVFFHFDILAHHVYITLITKFHAYSIIQERMEERWDSINKRFVMLVSVVLAIFISSKISSVTINQDTSGGNALLDPNLISNHFNETWWV